MQVAFVHHTVSANDYAPEEVPSIILSICRYHRNSNGWNDIGYNFLVDKYGTIWEGRAGGIDQAIVGAQAQGYNSHSTGIAFTPAAMRVRWTRSFQRAGCSVSTIALTGRPLAANAAPARSQLPMWPVAWRLAFLVRN